MCDTVTVSGKSSSTSSTGAVDVLGVVVLGALIALWWLVRKVAGPALVIAVVLGWRWLSGANLSGRPRVAKFRRPSPFAAPPRRWDRLGLMWAHAPGYQRALVRWAVTLLVVSACRYPLVTTAAVAAVGLVAVGLTVRRRRRTRKHTRNGPPALSPAVAARPAQPTRPAPALTAAPAPTLTARWWLDGLGSDNAAGLDMEGRTR